RLPVGIEAYFERVLSAMEFAGRDLSKTEHERALRAKTEMLRDLEKLGRVSPAEVGEIYKVERGKLACSASIANLEVLALIALAKEPLSISVLNVILSVDSAQTERALRIVGPVLDEQGEKFAMFHSAFRSFFLNRRHEVAVRVREKIVAW